VGDWNWHTTEDFGRADALLNGLENGAVVIADKAYDAARQRECNSKGSRLGKANEGASDARMATTVAVIVANSTTFRVERART
jgi:IS5 family transposase